MAALCAAAPVWLIPIPCVKAADDVKKIRIKSENKVFTFNSVLFENVNRARQTCPGMELKASFEFINFGFLNT